MAYCIYNFDALESIRIEMEYRKKKKRKFLGITFGYLYFGTE